MISVSLPKPLVQLLLHQHDHCLCPIVFAEACCAVSVSMPSMHMQNPQHPYSEHTRNTCLFCESTMGQEFKKVALSGNEEKSRLAPVGFFGLDNLCPANLSALCCAIKTRQKAMVVLEGGGL